MYYATGNSGKFQEVLHFFKTYMPEIEILMCDRDFPEIQTLDQRTIAVDKARQAWGIFNNNQFLQMMRVFILKNIIISWCLYKICL